MLKSCGKNAGHDLDKLNSLGTFLEPLVGLQNLFFKIILLDSRMIAQTNKFHLHCQQLVGGTLVASVWQNDGPPQRAGAQDLFWVTIVDSVSNG